MSASREIRTGYIRLRHSYSNPMNELLLVFSTVVLIFIAYKINQRSRFYPATADDWFIVVKTSVEAKQVSFNFYPIFGFEIRNGICEPLTSQPGTTKKHWRASHASDPRSAQTSEEYGRWFRHGKRYNEFGAICWTNLSFPVLVWTYTGLGYSIISSGTPPSYEKYLEKQIPKAKNKD